MLEAYLLAGIREINMTSISLGKNKKVPLSKEMLFGGLTYYGLQPHAEATTVITFVFGFWYFIPLRNAKVLQCLDIKVFILLPTLEGQDPL